MINCFLNWSSVVLLRCVTVGFVLQADKEADLLRGGWDSVREGVLVGERGGRLGDLPVAAIEIHGGESRRVIPVHGFFTFQVQGWRTQAFSQTGITVGSKFCLNEKQNHTES